MNLYRVCPGAEFESFENGIKKLFNKNTSINIADNTHKYKKKEEYIHFFKYAESAKLYKDAIYGKKKDAYIIKCDIPSSVIEQSSLGYGFYQLYGPRRFEEYAIPLKLFNTDYIVDFDKDGIKEEWLDLQNFYNHINISYINDELPVEIYQNCCIMTSLFDYNQKENEKILETYEAIKVKSR